MNGPATRAERTTLMSWPAPSCVSCARRGAPGRPWRSSCPSRPDSWSPEARTVIPTSSTTATLIDPVTWSAPLKGGSTQVIVFRSVLVGGFVRPRAVTEQPQRQLRHQRCGAEQGGPRIGSPCPRGPSLRAILFDSELGRWDSRWPAGDRVQRCSKLVASVSACPNATCGRGHYRPHLCGHAYGD